MSAMSGCFLKNFQKNTGFCVTISAKFHCFNFVFTMWNRFWPILRRLLFNSFHSSNCKLNSAKIASMASLGNSGLGANTRSSKGVTSNELDQENVNVLTHKMQTHICSPTAHVSAKSKPSVFCRNNCCRSRLSSCANASVKRCMYCSTNGSFLSIFYKATKNDVSGKNAFFYLCRFPKSFEIMWQSSFFHKLHCYITILCYSLQKKRI